MQRRASAPLRRRSSSDSRQPASCPAQPPLPPAVAAVGGAAAGGAAAAAAPPAGLPFGGAAPVMDFAGPDLSAAHSHFDEFFALASGSGRDPRWPSGGLSNGGGGDGDGCGGDACGAGSGGLTFSSCGHHSTHAAPVPFLVGRLSASHGASGQSQGGSTYGNRFSGGSLGHGHCRGGSDHGSHDFGCGSDLFSGSNFGGCGPGGSVRTTSDPECGAAACDLHHRAVDGLPPRAHSLNVPPGTLQRRTSSWESTATAAAATYTSVPVLSAAMATLAAYTPGPSTSASPWSSGAHMHLGMDMPMCPPGMSPQVKTTCAVDTCVQVIF